MLMRPMPPADVGLWEWFRDRTLPPLFVALTVGVCGAAWWTAQAINQFAGHIAQIEREQQAMKTEIASLKAATVTRAELLETLKRVEQQMEIMMLRAGMRPAKTQ